MLTIDDVLDLLDPMSSDYDVPAILEDLYDEDGHPTFRGMSDIDAIASAHMLDD